MLKKGCLILILVLFSATFLHAEAYREFKLQPRTKTGHQKSDKLQLKINELSRELNLTVEQVAKLKELLLESRKETDQVLKEAKESIRNIRIKTNESIASLLDDKQKAKFKRIRKKYEIVSELEE